ncbi:MAG TPA: alkaline phosphatase family protein [Conexibacter sp.]|nr:alkaline phosphatase family protein [Conexibacter sp.]
MTPTGCHECAAPLAAEQRWCVVCGARQAGADPRTLLFGPPAPADPGPTPSTATPLPSSSSDPALLATRRRRRAALPVALASLVGLVVVSGASVPASLADSAQSPFTVVLPAQVAQQVVAQAAPAEEAPAPPAEDSVEPVAEAPPAAATPAAATPAATDETPVAQTPAAEEERPAEEAPATDDPPAESPAETSPIGHVFLIALGATDLTALTSDETAAPYLTGTLAKRGTLLSDYRTIARGTLANRIALISGQGPTPQTLDDCTTLADVRPADALPNGQTGGDGCIYGSETGHLGDQLRGLQRTWKAYVEPAAEASSDVCRTDAATTRRNPFLWFRATVEADDCDSQNAPLTRLKQDLTKAATTPALAWIASDAQQGSADADRFLERVVPQIQDSPAYADGGLIVIVGDQPPAPETPAPPTTTTPAPTPTTPVEPPTATAPRPPATLRPLGPARYPNVGDAAAAGAGAAVGALLISPFTPSGKVDATPADAFTLLRTLQQIYGVDPLGYAAAKGVRPLPDTLFSLTPERAGDGRSPRGPQGSGARAVRADRRATGPARRSAGTRPSSRRSRAARRRPRSAPARRGARPCRRRAPSASRRPLRIPVRQCPSVAPSSQCDERV